MSNKKTKATIDDGMNPELVRGANFDGYLGIPIIKHPNQIIIPNDIVPNTKIKYCNDPNIARGFNEKDMLFSDVLKSPEKYIEEFCKCPMISPDCSLYRDAPLSVQIANVYRNRAIGYYYQSHGAYVIPQIRWGNELTYTTKVLPERVAFLGVEKQSVVAIGSYGCTQTKEDKYHLEAGLSSMLETIEPKVVLVYGPMNPKIFNPYLNDTRFVQYDDWISRKRRRM